MAEQIYRPAYELAGFSSEEEYQQWLAGQKESNSTLIQRSPEGVLQIEIQGGEVPTEEQVTPTTSAPQEASLKSLRPDLFSGLTAAPEQRGEGKSIQQARPDLFSALKTAETTPEEPEFETSLYPSLSDVDQSGGVKRSFIRGIEGFNEPFRGLTNLALNLSINPLARALGKDEVEWRDPRDFMPSPQSRAEDIASVGLESVGTTMSYLIPFSIGARLYSGVLRTPALSGNASTVLYKTLPKNEGVTQRTVSSLRNFNAAIRSTPELIARTYQVSPLQNAFLETAFAVGAGTGAAVAEALFPGDVQKRTVGEVLGGFGPGPMIARAGTKATDGFGRVVNAFSKDERQKVKLAKVLQNYIEERVTREMKASGEVFGSKPTAEQAEKIEQRTQQALADAISSLGRPQGEVKLTSGLLSQNQDILAFEMGVIKQSPEIGDIRADRIRSAFKEFDDYVAKELASGDPTRLREAAELAYSRYVETFDSDITQARQMATEAVGKLRAPEGQPIDPRQASDEAYRIISGRLARARQTETALWNKTPDVNPYTQSMVGNEPLYARSVATYNEIRASIPEADRVAFEKDFQLLSSLQNARQEGLSPEEVLESGLSMYSSKRLLTLRSRLLEQGRNSLGGSNPSRLLAANYYKLADAVLDDLMKLPINSSGEIAQARAFSKALHESWTNTFAGNVVPARIDENNALQPPLAQEITMAPENLLESAFRSGGTVGSRRFADLREAAIVPRVGVDGQITLDSSIYGPAVKTTQEQFLRYHIGKMANKEGRITSEGFNRFISIPANRETLESMPDLWRDLTDVRTAEEALASVISSNKVNKRELERGALSALLGKASPNKAVASVLQNADAAENIAQLANEARRSGESALGGLRSAMLDYAYSRANSTSGLSFMRFRELLQNPVSAGELSIQEMLIKNRIMTQPEIDNLNDFIGRGAEIERILSSPEVMSSIDLQVDPLSDLALRLVSAKAGTQLSKMGPGGGGNELIVAGQTIRTAKNIFQNTPLMKVRQLAEQAVLNPKFLQDVLKTQYTGTNRGELEAQINLFLLNAGIDSQGDYEQRQTSFGIWEDPNSFQIDLSVQQQPEPEFLDVTPPDAINMYPEPEPAPESVALENPVVRASQNLIDTDLEQFSSIARTPPQGYAEGLNSRQTEIVDTYRPLWSSLERQYNLPKNFLETVAFLESSYRPNVVGVNNPDARGLFQFTSSAQQDFPHDAFDPEETSVNAARLNQRNARRLTQRLERQPTPAEMYLAHQQGADGAADIITADPNTLAMDARLSRGAIERQNMDPDTTTVQQFIDKFTNRYNETLRSIEGNATTTD